MLRKVGWVEGSGRGLRGTKGTGMDVSSPARKGKRVERDRIMRIRASKRRGSELNGV